MKKYEESLHLFRNFWSISEKARVSKEPELSFHLFYSLTLIEDLVHNTKLTHCHMNLNKKLLSVSSPFNTGDGFTPSNCNNHQSNGR
jgi:hypothetical protein